MINMMMAINKDNFEGKREVTCYPATEGRPDQSAHLSSLTKGRGPPMKKGRNPEETKQSYLRQSSSSTNISRRRRRRCCAENHEPRAKGNTHVVRRPAFPAEVYSKAPGKRFSVMHLPGGESVTAFDGNQGWLSVPGRVHMMSAAENAAARIDADFYLPVHLKTLYQKFQVNAGDKIDGQKPTWLWGKPKAAPTLLIPGQGVGLAVAADPLRRNSSRPQPNPN